MKEKDDGLQAGSRAPGADLDELEATLLKGILGSFGSPTALGGTPAQGPPEGENDLVWLTQQYKKIIQRLALLEEHVARMCNVLGRLEQAMPACRGSRGLDDLTLNHGGSAATEADRPPLPPDNEPS